MTGLLKELEVEDIKRYSTLNIFYIKEIFLQAYKYVNTVIFIPRLQFCSLVLKCKRNVNYTLIKKQQHKITTENPS